MSHFLLPSIQSRETELKSPLFLLFFFAWAASLFSNVCSAQKQIQMHCKNENYLKKYTKVFQNSPKSLTFLRGHFFHTFHTFFWPSGQSVRKWFQTLCNNFRFLNVVIKLQLATFLFPISFRWMQIFTFPMQHPASWCLLCSRAVNSGLPHAFFPWHCDNEPY